VKGGTHGGTLGDIVLRTCLVEVTAMAAIPINALAADIANGNIPLTIIAETSDLVVRDRGGGDHGAHGCQSGQEDLSELHVDGCLGFQVRSEGLKIDKRN